jgi:hypothetical protein
VLPETVDLDLAKSERRPGDLRESLVLDLAPFPGFRAAVGAAGIPADLGVVLAYERRLVLDDAATTGLAEIDAGHILNDEATNARPNQELVSAANSYLRAIGAGRRPTRPVARGRFVVAVPVRFYSRAVSLDLQRVLVPAGVAEAISWEVASVLAARTMTEWALRVLLVSQGAQARDVPAAPELRPRLASPHGTNPPGMGAAR